MTGTAILAILLLLAGVVTVVPVAIILAIVILLLEVVRAIWAANGLRGLRYRRTLARHRMTWGEEIPTTVEVWNRKGLPLAWLTAGDAASVGVTVRERTLAIGDDGGPVLRNAWTLAPFERVTRHFHLGATRRGSYEVGPVDLAVGDLFARQAVAERRMDVDRFLVRPRAVATDVLQRRDRWGGVDRALAGLSEDPSRFAGVREYAPGDPVRRVHARASARLGRPVVKVFEPSRDREVLIALDVKTHAGPMWAPTPDDDLVESLFVVAASLARSLAAERASFGLAAAGYHGSESRFAIVAPSEAPGQLERILDLLARLSAHPSAAFDRLLATIARTIRPGTTIVVVTARDPSPDLPHLRRLERAGCPVVVVACGPNRGGRRGTRAQRGTGRAGRQARWTVADGQAPVDRRGHASAKRMTVSDRSTQLGARIVELAPVGLVIVAEAAWIAVLGGLIQEFTFHDPQLGIMELALVVASGAILAHALIPRLGRRWPPVALGLVIVAGLLGTLASGASRASLAAGIGPALAAHPAGVLAGLAMLRGFAHARLPLAEGTLTRLLALGVPGLALAALFGGVIAEPFRSRFLADTLVASIVFVGATVLALAFARLGAIGDDAGVDWRRNPAWLGLTLMLLIGAIAAALPLAVVAGVAIPILVGLALGPMLILGLTYGLDRKGRRVLLIVAIVVAIIDLRALLGGNAPAARPTQTPTLGIPDGANPDADRMLTIGLGALLVLIVVVTILVLIALWMRRTHVQEEDDLDETRVVDRDTAEDAVWSRRRLRFRRRTDPDGAVDAYVALLAELDGHPPVRREAGETPMEHAARLRRAGAPALRLDLLAADYALVRDGGLALSAREDRRAVDRWRSLRRSLPRWARQQTDAAEALAQIEALAEGSARHARTR